MKSKLLGCLAATALGAAIVVATPAMAFRGGGGFHGGGFRGGGMHFGGGGFHGRMFAGPRVFAPGGSRFVGAPFARGHVFGHRFNNFAFRHRHRFRNFAFLGVPFLYDDYNYDAYGTGCWTQIWTGYGWQWANVCYDYGY